MKTRSISWTRPHSAGTAAAALAGTLALMLTACGGGAAEDGESSAGGRDEALIIAENEPPASFDPALADNSTVDEVVIPAYDTLVQYDAEGALQPQLATEWTVSDDGTSVDFTLRDDVTFHDGAKLTADDVKYTLDRIKKLGIGVASQLSAYDSTVVNSPTSLTIKLTHPFAPFVPALSRAYILNSALVKENAGDDNGQTWLGTNDAGSGPYQLTEYQPNRQASYTAYEDYWGGWDGQATSVVFQYIAEASTQRESLRNGDIDIAMDIAPNDRAPFEEDSNFAIDQADTNVQLYAFFNTESGPTADPKVREALSYAYDYATHSEEILNGAGKPAVGPLPQSMLCHDDSVITPAFDLQKAADLLADAGAENLSLTMTYLPALDEENRGASMFQSALREIGVDLKLNGTTWPQYIEMIKSADTTPDIAMNYAFPAYPDPDSVLSVNFDSKFIDTGYNYARYSNSTVDDAVRAAQASTDEAERCDLYSTAQQEIADDFVAINISNPQYVTVMRAGIEGYAYRPAHHQTVDVYGIKVS